MLDTGRDRGRGEAVNAGTDRSKKILFRWQSARRTICESLNKAQVIQNFRAAAEGDNRAESVER